MIWAQANLPPGRSIPSALFLTRAITRASPRSSPQTISMRLQLPPPSPLARRKARPSAPSAKTPSPTESANACVPASSKCAAPLKSTPPTFAAKSAAPPASALDSDQFWPSRLIDTPSFPLVSLQSCSVFHARSICSSHELFRGQVRGGRILDSATLHQTQQGFRKELFVELGIRIPESTTMSFDNDNAVSSAAAAAPAP